jgi:hypothetical protein
MENKNEQDERRNDSKFEPPPITQVVNHYDERETSGSGFWKTLGLVVGVLLALGALSGAGYLVYNHYGKGKNVAGTLTAKVDGATNAAATTPEVAKPGAPTLPPKPPVATNTGPMSGPPDPPVAPTSTAPQQSMNPPPAATNATPATTQLAGDILGEKAQTFNLADATRVDGYVITLQDGHKVDCSGTALDLWRPVYAANGEPDFRVYDISGCPVR